MENGYAAAVIAENRTYKFYAFVGHAEGGEDEKAARWIGRKLASCRVPVETITKLRSEDGAPAEPIPKWFSVAGAQTKGEKNRVSDLARYLIVVCSPRSARSERTERVVRDFVESGKEDYVIPLIIGGEPVGPEENRCYPPSLSAEILGISLLDGSREEAFIRVMARMLRVKFSRLYQRHLRERRRFMVRALAAASGVLFILSGLTAWAVRREIEASRRRENVEGLMRFITSEIMSDPRLPKDVRATAGNKGEKMLENTRHNTQIQEKTL